MLNAPFDYEGTTSPAAFLLNTNATQGIGMGFVLGSDSGAAATSGARLGYIGFRGAIDANHDLYQGAAISAYTAQAWTSTQGGSSINFETTHQNAAARTTDLTVTNGTVIVRHSPPRACSAIPPPASCRPIRTSTSRAGPSSSASRGTSLGEVTLNGNTSGTVNILPGGGGGHLESGPAHHGGH